MTGAQRYALVAVHATTGLDCPPPAPPHTHRTGQRLADNPGRTDTAETALEWTAGGGLEDRSHGSFDVVFDSPRRKRTINDPSAS